MEGADKSTELWWHPHIFGKILLANFLSDVFQMAVDFWAVLEIDNIYVKQPRELLIGPHLIKIGLLFIPSSCHTG